ncbi:hypothetical protein P7C73_g1422, partial [Tremellales sp. Uapishka_1]
MVPESPIVDMAFASPDIRGESSAGLSRNTSFPSRFLPPPSPDTLLPILEESMRNPSPGNDLRSSLVLRHAIRYGVEHGDGELVGWLINLGGAWGEMLDDEVQELEDEDGWGLIGMSLQHSCGRQDREEIVRALAGRWGLAVGPRNGRDNTGWTPLHLASLISTPPLVSFILNRGSSPHALTNRGLTPLDLIIGMQDREDVGLFLDHAMSTSKPPRKSDENTLSESRRRMLIRRRVHATKKLQKVEMGEMKLRVRMERENFIREKSRFVEVDPDLLVGKNPLRDRRSADSGIGWQVEDEMSGESEGEEEGESEVEDEVFTETDLNQSTLAFSLSDLPAIFDIFISSYRPVATPIPKRTLPANSLFLYARFALYRCHESWLEELIEGAVEKIEQGIYSNVEDLAYLSFWAYNTTVLLYLLRSDDGLRQACEEMNLMSLVEELINAIHVFVIRVAERRIDQILDVAILEYEILEDFDDVRFEGEWSIFRSFAGKKKKERETILPRPQSSVFNPGGLDDSPPSVPRLNKHQSMMDLKSSPSSLSESAESLHSDAGASLVGPKSITDILSGVLLVLQIYQVNPAIIVQAFSQIFFWISCELFNRILTRKKYLCRSKAIQIRMNITILEDWIRANGLPSRTATKHLEPVTQLLQWLQTQSSVNHFDTLIGTIQNMKILNPLQMRRAVRDYKYEIAESRMTEECFQYLTQFQKDWEKRRIDVLKRSASEDSDPYSSSTPIDHLFDGSIALSDFNPQSAPECLGELLDSRFMLPFLLPDSHHLIATPPKDSAYPLLLGAGLAFGTSTLMDASNRPPSRSSFASARPMGWEIPDERKLERLPRDFFGWLKKSQAEQRLLGDREKVVEPRPVEKIAIDTSTTDTPYPPPSNDFPREVEGETTPVAKIQPPPRPPPRVRNLEPVIIPFQPVQEMSRSISDSYELRSRESVDISPSTAPLSARIHGSGYVNESPISPTSETKRKWWKLGRKESSARLRREESEDTVRGEESDVITPGTSGGKSKFWER